jgi:MraZ protein
MDEPKFILSGRFDHTIDDKGRIMLPSLLRDELKKSINPEKLYLGHYPGTKYLSVYPAERWLTLVENWQEEKRFQTTALMLEAQRLFFANIEPVAVDKVGRILVPAIFREKIGLGTQVAFLGVGRKMEIWDAQELKAHEVKAMEIWEKAMADEVNRVGQDDSARLPQF